MLRATGAEKLQARCTQTEGEVVFLFPGGGSQYPNMGRELYEKESLYREEVDRCALLLLPILGFDIRAELYPSAAEPRAASAPPSRGEVEARRVRNCWSAGSSAPARVRNWASSYV